MERDPLHAAAHPPAEDHVHPAREASAASSTHFGSGGDEPDDMTAFAKWVARGRSIWRRHLQRDQAPEATGRPRGNVERWLLALLSVVVIVSCACVTIVFTQVRSLKAEITTLQREIIALKLHVARLDQIASVNEARDRPSSETPKPPAEPRPDQGPLILSREEIQLIRDFIKPAPITGSTTEPIKVGDPVAGDTIPFPSPITEKVRRLLGARFTIRNGIIVITRNGSRQADAVIGPN